MIQIERADARITLITAEDEDGCRMGVQGITVTGQQAIELLAVATNAWRGGTVTMAPAPNVGMG